MRWSMRLIFVEVLFVAGCPSNPPFHCEEDAQCTGVPGGRCEPSGVCSFPDPDCPTGRRYGEAATEQVAGDCVPVDQLGSTGVEAGSGGGEASTSSGSLTTSEASGTTQDSGGDDSTGSTSAASDSSSSGGSSTSGSSSTGDPGPPAGMYEPCPAGECGVGLGCASLYSIDGQLLASFCTVAECEDPLLDCSDPGTGAVPRCADLPLHGGPGVGCALDCGTDSGGCPAGMSCFDQFANLEPFCFHSA